MLNYKKKTFKSFLELTPPYFNKPFSTDDCLTSIIFKDHQK